MYIKKLRGGKLAVTYGSITYLYEDLPAEARFEVAKQLRRICPDYLVEYKKFRARFCEIVAEKMVINKLIKINKDIWN